MFCSHLLWLSRVQRLSRLLLLSGPMALGFPVLAQAQRLEIIPPPDPAALRLYRGDDSVDIRKVRMADAESLGIEKVWCRYQPDGEVPPDGTPDVKVVGLGNVTLAKDQEVEIALVLPAYSKIAAYSAALYFKKKGGPEEGEKFYAFRIDVLEPSGALSGAWAHWVGPLSFAFPAVILFFTVLLKSPAGRNFFQSPDPAGSYSLSRVQVWLWTNIVIFSYAYLYFTRGPNTLFPDSIWCLMGISLSSIGAATVLAVQKDQTRAQAALPAGSAAPAASPSGPLPPPMIGWFQSMLSEDGNPSIMRLQMFAWTIATAVFFVRQVFTTGMLWDVPSSLLVLMGISHASYLVDKGAQK